MSRLIASDNALRAMLVLSQARDGMRTSEVARALEVSYTGAEKALGILVADGLARRSGRRYAIDGSPRARETVRFTLAFLPAEMTLQALARANEAVEFAGMDDLGALVVFRRFTEPAAEGRLRDAVAVLEQVAPGTTVDFVRKEDLREQLLTDLAPRQRAAGMRGLTGTVDRTFPNRTLHGDIDARPLGHLSEAIDAPSLSRLKALARKYGLRRILVFGSATRADIRPDSDIDLLVEPVPGRHLGLDDRVGLMADLEAQFGRDVDLLTAPVRRPSLEADIRRNGVVLYDAAR